MNRHIVSSAIPITLIGGAEVAPDVLKAALRRAPPVVCADGGADTALWSELQPLAVIGDMDSISDAARDAYSNCLYPVAEQDSTDFDKALRHVDAPLVLGVGFLGARLDHALAALHVLLKYPERAVVLLGEDDVLFLAPPRVRLTLPVGTRVSLLPVADARVDTTGLKWDVTGAQMSMRSFIGSSNEAAAERVEIRSEGGLVIILPPEMLDAAIEGLKDAVPAG